MRVSVIMRMIERENEAEAEENETENEREWVCETE